MRKAFSGLKGVARARETPALLGGWGFFFAPIRSLPPVSLSHSICLVIGTAWVPSPKWGLWDGRFAISQGLLCREAILEGRHFY